MKKWKQLVVSLALVFGVSAVLVPASSASAINVFQSCSGNSSQVCKAATGKQKDNAYSMIKKAINVILGVLGIVAVIMIIIGGFRYVTSAGEAAAVKSAKNTIMYAVVGLIVAIFAFAIVNFVVGSF